MPEDIVDFHLHEGEEPAGAAPEETGSAQASGPNYVTREDLRSFGEAMAQQISASLRPAPTEAPMDWEQQFANRAADTATLRLLEVNKPIFAAQIAEQVAGDYGPEVKAEIMEELRHLPGHVVATITQSPIDLKRLTRMAKGIYAEKSGARAPISKAAGTVNGSTVSENDEADRYYMAYKDIGVTRDMARQWAKGGK